MKPRILAFAGCTRRESFKKLVSIAAKGARDAGTEVTLIDLKDFPLPLFDQDLEAEQGTPENGQKLKKLFIDHAGLLIPCPECNSSITAVLKNAIEALSPNSVTAVPRTTSSDVTQAEFNALNNPFG
jgi:NAD(P)H-dependent FMN reductase